MIVIRAGSFILTIALLTGTSALAYKPVTTAFAPSIYADTGRNTGALSAERVTKDRKSVV